MVKEKILIIALNTMAEDFLLSDIKIRTHPQIKKDKKFIKNLKRNLVTKYKNKAMEKLKNDL